MNLPAMARIFKSEDPFGNKLVGIKRYFNGQQHGILYRLGNTYPRTEEEAEASALMDVNYALHIADYDRKG